jgi:DNA polymerase III epsilon subunit-like protein
MALSDLTTSGVDIPKSEITSYARMEQLDNRKSDKNIQNQSLSKDEHPKVTVKNDSIKSEKIKSEKIKVEKIKIEPTISSVLKREISPLGSPSVARVAAVDNVSTEKVSFQI